ncbi:hypothetical protein AAG906_038355 [Vitis piasezkii]
MTKELKDDYSNDDPIIDIAKLFGTPTMSGEFSVYIKKSRILQHPFTDPTKRKKLRKEIDESLTLFDLLHPTSKEIKKKWFQSLSNHGSWLADMPLYSIKWPDVDIVYVPINVWAILTLIIYVPCNGDYGMFIIKYVEYLMHNHPLKSLTSARMDWFQEKMVAELFYMKYLPM